MATPNFLCIGAPKAGTTTLFHILNQHPDIYIPAIKETEFFVDDKRYEKGPQYYEEKFFSKWNGEQAIGEICPNYFHFDYVSERIFKTLGSKVQLIFIFRNPVHRAYSHYRMSSGNRFETNPFKEAILLENERETGGRVAKSLFSYISTGFYAKHLNRYLKYFSKEQMFFIVFETEFVQNRDITVSKLLEFLNVKEAQLNIAIQSHRAFTYRSKVVMDFIHKPPRLIKAIVKTMIPDPDMRKRIKVYLNQKNRLTFLKS